MTQYLNKAAIDSWVDASDSVRSRLEQIFKDSGREPEAVDMWTNQMIRNTFEAAPEPQSSALLSE